MVKLSVAVKQFRDWLVTNGYDTQKLTSHDINKAITETRGIQKRTRRNWTDLLREQGKLVETETPFIWRLAE